MKPGDLIYADWHDGFDTDKDKWGIILEKMEHNSLNRKYFGLNSMFRVLWQDGTIGNNVWEYDLTIV
jgi:hypothetical protein